MSTLCSMMIYFYLGHRNMISRTGINYNYITDCLFNFNFSSMTTFKLRIESYNFPVKNQNLLGATDDIDVWDATICIHSYDISSGRILLRS